MMMMLLCDMTVRMMLKGEDEKIHEMKTEKIEMSEVVKRTQIKMIEFAKTMNVVYWGALTGKPRGGYATVVKGIGDGSGEGG